MEASSSSSSPSKPSLEDSMKLLRGKTDSQRLAGLLLVTKFCDKDNVQTISKVYEAVGPTFLHRLLLTGLGKGNGELDISNCQAYLRLSVTVLASFVRVPEIAVKEEVRAKIPLIIEVLSKESDPSITDECYEFLFLVLSAHDDDGVATFVESGGVSVLASQIGTFKDGSHTMELALRLFQLIISKYPAEKVYVSYPVEISRAVAAISKQFAVLHTSLKFEALHLLSTILSSSYSGALHTSLKSTVSDDWWGHIRVGILSVLQNRVSPEEKLHALVLAECVMSIVGEEFLIGSQSSPNVQSNVTNDRCVMLVLESARVEIAVMLNELAYSKYEAPSNNKTFRLKLMDLGVAFSLVERIIKIISRLGENEDSNSILSETTLMKIIHGLNETISLVLDYLQDAKEHGERKGDDLLASVRVLGSYLAEAPDSCKDKVNGLLSYMLSVEGENEISSLISVSFLLPLLCQITMTDDGCKIFASVRAFRPVIECLTYLVDPSTYKNGNDSTVFLACDTVMNFLLKSSKMHFSLDDKISSVKLLKALPLWTAGKSEASVIMMASSMCALLLEFTSEEALMQCRDFKNEDLIGLAELVKRALISYGKNVMMDDNSSEADLHEIVVSKYYSWADRFPRIKNVVER